MSYGKDASIAFPTTEPRLKTLLWDRTCPNCTSQRKKHTKTPLSLRNEDEGIYQRSSPDRDKRFPVPEPILWHGHGQSLGEVVTTLDA